MNGHNVKPVRQGVMVAFIVNENFQRSNLGPLLFGLQSSSESYQFQQMIPEVQFAQGQLEDIQL